jgi:hypothetical protein
MLNIAQAAGDEVVHTNHMIPFTNEPVAQMRTQKPGGTGNQYPFLFHGMLV